MKFLKSAVLSSMLAFTMGSFTSCGNNVDSSLNGDISGSSGGYSTGYDYSPRCNTAAAKTTQFKLAFNRNASDSDRARCLASSVRGIGESTAQDLVRSGELRYAPSSWDEFKSFMKSLDSKGYSDLYENTVQRYGSDNSKLFTSSTPAPRPRPVTPTCDTGASAKSQFALAFDSRASRSDRARCLASSVRGIGESTAEDLVRNGELRHKPGSWNEFKSYMKSLESKGYSNIYENTVARYGSDNSKLFK